MQRLGVIAPPSAGGTASGPHARGRGTAAGEERPPPRLGIIGAFGRGNLGADAALEAMVSTILSLRPDAEILCVCDTPGVVETRFKVRGAAMSWVPAHPAARILNRLLLNVPRAIAMAWCAVSRLRHIDVLMVPGTHLFDDYAAGTRSARPALLTWITVARAMGKRIALVSVGAGPFASRLDRRLAGFIADAAELRSYRDGTSKQHMASTRRDVRHDPVCPDLMFKLPEPQRVSPRPLDGAAMTVGVDVVTRDQWPAGLGDYETYAVQLASFVHWLLDRGLTVRLLKGDATDDGAIAAFAESVNRRRFGQSRERLLSGTAHSLNELMQQIAETDIVAASHYHVAVGALKLGKPALSLSLSDANDALLAEMGFTSFSQPIGAIDGDLLNDQFTRLVVDRKAYQRGIHEVRVDLERRLAEQEARLAGLLR